MSTVAITFAILFAAAVLAQPNTWRTFDGTGNNQANPNWGSVGVRLIRKGPSTYADSISAPTNTSLSAGTPLPSARVVSNTIFGTVPPNGEQPKSNLKLSDFTTYWGQFLDHDLDLTGGPMGGTVETMSIPIPSGDAFFDPLSFGNQSLVINRSVYDRSTGNATANPRQQVNLITAYVDASMVYGVDPALADFLRTKVDGKLKTTTITVSGVSEEMPPLNTNWTNANDAHVVNDTQLYLLGDVRGNENAALTCLHTLFIREHNRRAAELKGLFPFYNDEQLYQEARKWVTGLIQQITLNEYAVVVLGETMGRYRGYNATLNAGIMTEFSTGAFRYGHSEVNTHIWRKNADGSNVTQGHLPLRNAFFNSPNTLNLGIDPILRGLAAQTQNEVDIYFVDDLRNYLFGNPGRGGLDLAAVNTQRGRDHGITRFNQARVAFGLAPITTFTELTNETVIAAKLASLYASVDDCDLYVCGLAEKHVRGANLGATFKAIIKEQYDRFRHGDRFWFENPGVFNQTDLDLIKATTLYDVIIRNTKITGTEIQCYVMGGPDGCGKPVANSNTSLIRITTAVKTPAHPYYNVGITVGYTVNGVEGAVLNLTRGTTYSFLVSAACSHSMYISTDPVGAGKGQIFDGVDNAFACGSTILTFTPGPTTPDVVYYQCQYHDNMGYKFNILGATATTTGSAAATTAAVASTGAGSSTTAYVMSDAPTLLMGTLYLLIALVVAY